ncbi:MAG: hypothetical protein HY922_01345 [Elusimicrobia bacterium]|nr:hypothetical protein [Elusimicrobiota bacterium]
MLDTDGLLRRISPAETAKHGAPPRSSALYLAGLDDSPAPGRPWWVADSTLPQWRWSGPERIKVSLPWPVASDGFATIELDGDGLGYVDGQTIPLNEDAAKAAWRRFREAQEERSKSFAPPFEPTPAFTKAETKAKAAIVEAQQAPDPVKRARLFDKALSRISEAWQTMLFDHGRQAAREPKTGPALRFGLTLDETLVDRLPEHSWIAERISKSGATWVRLVFRTNADDFLYAQPRSFSLYDSFIQDLRARNIRIMGSVLDSALWPKGADARAYVLRTRNLVARYKDSIRSWEVASEPNGSWIGGYKNPLPDETVLEAANAGAAEAKRIDPSIETVATLYWWEGTAKDDRHPLFSWLKWSIPKGFGLDIDVVGLSVYPDENPLSLAFDPVFLKLHKVFPDKKLMLGGFGYVEQEELKGYWWLDPGSIGDARADILILYTGAACALPQGVGGGFFFATLQQMLAPGRRTTPLYGIYRSTLKRLKGSQ